MQRYVPAAYADGRGEPRGGMASSANHCATGNNNNNNNNNGSMVRVSANKNEKCPTCVGDPAALLPNPRVVSYHFDQAAAPLEDKWISFMMIIFSQFLDHDLTLAPEKEVEGGCCSGPYRSDNQR